MTCNGNPETPVSQAIQKNVNIEYKAVPKLKSSHYSIHDEVCKKIFNTSRANYSNAGSN